MQAIKRLVPYLEDTIGLHITLNPLPKNEMEKLPMYLIEGYTWHKAELAGRPCILAEIKDNSVGVNQLEKHYTQVGTLLGLPIIGVFKQIESFNRKRLIEKRLAFVVPDKQLYIPEFLIDLKEFGITKKKEHKKLTSTAQVLVLYHILNNQKDKQLETKTFKEIAFFLETNPMSVTRAVDNLKSHDLIEIKGNKEKFIKFRFNKSQLWMEAKHRNLFVNPVLKRKFVNEKPEGILFFLSNTSALPEYSNINPSRQEYYALEKKVYYNLKKTNALVNSNWNEGRYCIEIWKYNPEKLVGVHRSTLVVDPLSLYLSLIESHDERIEMALEQIIKKYIW